MKTKVIFLNSMIFRYRPRSEKRRDSNASTHSTQEKRQAILPATNIIESRHATTQPISTAPSTVSYNLGHNAIANNAIAAAASQAIAATQQVRKHNLT